VARENQKTKLAASARELLGNEALDEIFHERRNDVISAWEAAATPQERERRHAELTALTELRDYLYERAREWSGTD